MKKVKVAMKVLESTPLAEGVYSLWLQYEEKDVPAKVLPGQFVGVYTKDGTALLPRPISICRWDEEKAALRLVYRAVGKGTGQFADLQPSDTVDVLGILGNGYDMEALKGKKVLLLGGGIGIPPMLGLAAACKAAGGDTEAVAVLGYRNNDLFLKEDFDKLCPVLIATEDGSVGTKGTVLDAIREQKPSFDAICACGPMPMLRAVKRFAGENGVPCYISLEERMACGVGACLGCVCKTTKKDAHSHVNNTRICTEGPVFAAEEVEIG